MKNKNIDKGFVLWFDNLSYRRKFIRTNIIFICFVLIMAFFNYHLDMREAGDKYLWAMILTVFPIQSIYYYRKWRKEIQKNN